MREVGSRWRRVFPQVSHQWWADVGPAGLYRHGAPEAGTVANMPKHTHILHAHTHIFTAACWTVCILLYCITRSWRWVNAQWSDESSIKCTEQFNSYATGCELKVICKKWICNKTTRLLMIFCINYKVKRVVAIMQSTPIAHNDDLIPLVDDLISFFLVSEPIIY